MLSAALAAPPGPEESHNRISVTFAGAHFHELNLAAPIEPPKTDDKKQEPKTDKKKDEKKK